MLEVDLYLLVYTCLCMVMEDKQDDVDLDMNNVGKKAYLHTGSLSAALLHDPYLERTIKRILFASLAVKRNLNLNIFPNFRSLNR